MYYSKVSSKIYIHIFKWLGFLMLKLSVVAGSILAYSEPPNARPNMLDQAVVSSMIIEK